MSRFSPILLALFTCFLVSGCQNSPTWLNPYAGYGSPRVPPPATGSYQPPNAPYYPQSPAPGGSASRNFGTPAQVASTTGGSTWQPVNGSSLLDAPAAVAIGSGVERNNAVAQAAFSQPTTTGSTATIAADPFQSASANSVVQASATSPLLQPMRVNDATGGRAAQPTMVARGQYIELSHLQPQVRPVFPGSNRLRGAGAPTQPGTLPTSALTAGPLATSTVPATQPAATTASGWRAKYTPTVGLR